MTKSLGMRKRGLRALVLGVAAAVGLQGAAALAAPKQGGDMVVTYKSDVTTLDPAIGYDWQNWPMLRVLFSRLMNYKPGTTELVKDAAESYTVSPDGKTYVFKLRPGLKFTSGNPLDAEAVKFSITRVIDPATASPGQAFYHSIKGYDAVVAGKTKNVSGIVVVDPRTIKFELSQPDATFLQAMAMNFADIIDPAAVKKWGKDVARHPVGSGPFMLKEWVPGQKLVFVRNPDYFIKGVPYLNKITFDVGQDPLVALLRLQRGEVDLLGDGIPPAKFLQVTQSPKWKSQVVVGHPIETSYITLNTQMKPFTDLRVRQAVNMAINKKQIVRLINGRGTPTNQVLPPNMPGYDKEYKGYSYDPAKAKELLKEAGYPNGFTTELYVYNTDPNPRIGQAIQAQLAQVGIKVQLRSLGQAQVIAAGGTPKTAAMIWSGGMAWVDDFPDPSDFYGPILGCGSAVQGGWNWAWYCNKETDAMAAKADTMVQASQTEERLALWRKVFRRVMADAPWVPVFNETNYTMHSKKVAGDPANAFADPGVFPFNYAYIYDTNVQ
ncbi:ABC transporter substrate-binding protein [Acidihalobacter prosperus]